MDFCVRNIIAIFSPSCELHKFSYHNVKIRVKAAPGLPRHYVQTCLGFDKKDNSRTLTLLQKK